MSASLRLPLLLAALTLTACGARSDVDRDLSDGAVARRDAGVGPTDGGPPPTRDAGPPRVDAGPPPGCGNLVPLTERLVVHEDSAGTLGSPQVVYREGGFDLVATFSAVDDDRIDDVRVRRLRLDGDEASLGEPVTLEFSPRFPAAAAARGRELGVLSSVSTGMPEPEVRLRAYTGSDYGTLFDAPVWTGRAVELAGGDDRWLVVVHDAGGTQVLTLDARGNLLTMPRPVVPPGPGADEVAVRATAVPAGFAWVGSPAGSSGTFAVGFIRDFEIDYAMLEGARPRFGDSQPLAIAPSPWGREQVLVAGYDSGVLFVAAAERDGERWRSEGLAFSLPVDGPPALVTGPFGAVLAGMHGGAADPTERILEVLLLGPRGAVRGPSFAFEARRAGSFGEAGIEAATDGEHVVVHYTHFVRERGVSQTQAMVFTCE